MTFNKHFWGAATFMVATTLGAEIFALPYVVQVAGWIVSGLYLFFFTGIIIGVHVLYYRALRVHREKANLGKLTEQYWGKMGSSISFVALVGGLLLTLVVYIILGSTFLRLLFPSLTASYAALLFWMVVSLPLFLGLHKLFGLESLVTVLMAGIILYIFGTDIPAQLSLGALPQNVGAALLPLGPILFALAGWTAIEPSYTKTEEEGTNPKTVEWAFVAGTATTAFLYILFVLAIFGAGGVISSDTVSGLFTWPAWKVGLLAWLGLFAIWTSYVPIGLEIKNTLIEGVGLSPEKSLLLVLFVPILLFLLGVTDFILVSSLVGGLFLSIQYACIVHVTKRILLLGLVKTFFLTVVEAVFFAAALFELWYFVLH